MHPRQQKGIGDEALGADKFALVTSREAAPMICVLATVEAEGGCLCSRHRQYPQPTDQLLRLILLTVETLSCKLKRDGVFHDGVPFELFLYLEQLDRLAVIHYFGLGDDCLLGTFLTFSDGALFAVALELREQVLEDYLSRCAMLLLRSNEMLKLHELYELLVGDVADEQHLQQLEFGPDLLLLLEDGGFVQVPQLPGELHHDVGDK